MTVDLKVTVDHLTCRNISGRLDSRAIIPKGLFGSGGGTSSLLKRHSIQTIFMIKRANWIKMYKAKQNRISNSSVNWEECRYTRNTFHWNSSYKYLNKVHLFDWIGTLVRYTWIFRKPFFYNTFFEKCTFWMLLLCIDVLDKIYT